MIDMTDDQENIIIEIIALLPITTQNLISDCKLFILSLFTKYFQ